LSDPDGNVVTPVADNPSGYPRGLEVDAGDALKVSIAKAGVQGIVKVSEDNTALPAGNSDMYSDAVPADTIWIVTNLAFMYVGTSPTRMSVTASDGLTGYNLFGQAAPASNQWYDRQGWWPLIEGYTLDLRVIGATLNDAMYLRAWGFSLPAS
jgi:hypothetical protein